MSQQQVARSIWLTVAMMAMSTLMLIAAVLSFIAHAPGVGEGFLAIMIVFGAASFASSFASRNRAGAFVAELIPFACLSLGLTIAREWRPVMAIGYLVGLFGTYTLSLIYLYKVLGVAVGWCLSLLPFIVGLMWVGGVTVVGSATTQSSQNSTGVKIVATGSWWIAGICLVAALVLIVMAAIVNGERWMQRNRHNLPRNKYEAYIRNLSSPRIEPRSLGPRLQG